ncbi:MAG: DUF962 domain-containing protein [Deltaproteobacteria bacterium]|nr:DUF962 domain-containing protein [Deltaproteobacteria bacterium]
MSDAPPFETFEEFWPYYVQEHANKTNRRLHFVGTSLALGTVAYALLRGKPMALLAAPLAGYGFAWVGHFLIEKNRPATFKYPLWSLGGDFTMFAKMLAGTMDEEVRRVMEVKSKASAANAPPSPDAPATKAPSAPRPSSPGRLN